MDKKEVEEELLDVFTFNVVLAQSSTYYRWRRLGVAQQLANDEGIACFLMDHYDKVTGASSVHGVCATCQSPLRLSCVNCGVVKSESSVEGTAEGGEMSTLGDSSIDKDGEMLQDSVASRIYGRRNCSSAERTRLSRVGGGECPEVLSKQQTVHARSEEVFKEEPTLRKQLEDQTADQGTTKQQCLFEDAGRMCNSSDSSFCDRDSSLSQRQGGREVTLQPHKQTASPAWPPPHVGRGRPRKYPEIPLVCVLCGKKLSSRMSVLNHMATQHPTAELPPALAPLAARRSTKTPPSSRRGRRRRVTQTGVQINTVSDSSLDGEVGQGAGDGSGSEKLKKRRAELEALVCETCGMTFEHRQQMYRHRRLCTWKVCHLCGKSVKLLDMHLKRHSAPRQFSCPHCPKTFLFRNYLAQHLLYHNGERPYCCEVCGMRYRERTRLNAHLRTHTGSKPFKCSQCDAAFTRPRGLNDHKRVHTGEKPYECQVCGRKFSSTGNLAAHRRKVHKMEPLTPNRMTRKLYVEPNAAEARSAADMNVG